MGNCNRTRDGGRLNNTDARLKRKTMLAEEWTEASCKGEDTEWWFSDDVEEARKAVAICDGCPIKQFCDDWATENHEYGIWGGKAHGEMEIAGRTGEKLNLYLRSTCYRGHRFDGERTVNGYQIRTCSTCRTLRYKRGEKAA